MDAKSEVDSYTMPLDAELAKIYLESFHIHVDLDGDVLGGAAFALGPMLGGIHLYVNEAESERASALLRDYHKSLRQPGVQVYESADEQVRRALRTSLLGLVLFPVLLHLHAISVLLRVDRRALSPKLRLHYLAAWVLSVAVIVAVAVYAVTLIRRHI